MKTIFFISNSIRKGRKGNSNSIIATITVTVSIAVMILAVSVSDGFKREIREKATGFSGEISINSLGFDINTSGYPVNKFNPLFDSVRVMQGVKKIQPYSYKPGIIKNGSNIQGIILKGVDSLYDWSFYKSNLVKGELPHFTGETPSNQILISARLGALLNYGKGDTLMVYFIDKSVRARRFVISGIYDAQLEEIDKTMIIGDMRGVQNLNGWDSSMVTGIEVRIDNYSNTDKTALKIEDLISGGNDETVSLIVTKVTDVYPNLFDWLRLLDFNVLVVMILMMTVAGFNMLSGLLIIIFERIAMIGTLKAVGMANADIHKVFLGISSYLVLKGILFGNIIALAIGYAQKLFKIVSLNPVNYFVKYVPIELNFEKIILIDLASFALIMLFLYIPLFFISKINPADAVKTK